MILPTFGLTRFQRLKHIMTDESLIDTAKDLAIVLRAEAGKGEKLRQLSPTAINAIEDSGLFAALVPQRFGGSEVDFEVIPQVVRELAKGDTSSAWVTAFLIHHNWQFALYPIETQEELWADRNYALAPATLAQLAARGSHNPKVASSILAGSIIFVPSFRASRLRAGAKQRPEQRPRQAGAPKNNREYSPQRGSNS